MKNTKYIYILAGLVLMCCIILPGSAWFIYPIPGSDAITFVPAAVSYARGEGLVNSIYWLACETDPAGLCRYCFHLPLMPWLAGALGKIHPTTQTVYLILAGFNLILLSILYTRFAKGLKYAVQPKSYLVLVALVLLSVTFYKLPTVGRPELLSSLFIVVLYVLFTKKDSHVLRLLKGVVLGLLMATQAVGFIIAAGFVVYYYFVKGEESTGKRFQFCSVVIFTGILVFTGVLLLSPNGLHDTMQGIINHWVHLQMDRSDSTSSKLINYWFLNPEGFMFGLVFLLAAYLWLIETVRNLRKIDLIGKLIVTGVVVFSFLCVYVFALKTAPTVYNISQFYPVLCLYIVARVFSNQPQPRGLHKLLIPAAIAIFGLSLIYPMRNIYLFYDTFKEGRTYRNAKKEIGPLLQNKEPIVVSWQLWCLTDDYSRIRIWDEKETQKGDIVVHQQARGELPDIITREFTLIKDWRCKNPDKLFGISISNRPQGYSFSVWKNENNKPQ